MFSPCVSILVFLLHLMLACDEQVKTINPLKGRGVNWLHFAIQVEPTFLISYIRALWRSAASARVPECQKLKM